MEYELSDQSVRALTEARVAAYRRKLESLAARDASLQVPTTVSVDWDYPTHEAIVRRAHLIRADLIVAECHRGRRMLPWLIHVTDSELLRTSPVPVLLVRTPQPYDHPLVLAAIDPTHAHGKPEKLDREILSAAGRIARALSGSVHAMHACLPVPLDVPSSAIRTDASAAQLYRAVRARARTLFERVARHARIPRARRHLIDTNSVLAIPETAHNLGADLVVMGAVARSGLKRVFIGNTAERALGALHCDVLVVKPRRFVSHVDDDVRGARLVAPQMPSVF
jgi:universal stress protein E